MFLLYIKTYTSLNGSFSLADGFTLFHLKLAQFLMTAFIVTLP